ncbi:MAG: S9 family peptidase [Archangiaceae bacterium]|nr:S9 family peptidase [Archangiaceae bacterium]
MAALLLLLLAAEPALIPRDVLLGNPERLRPQLSPDGTKLAWLQPDPRNVMQVWVRTLGQADDAPVTEDPKRGLRVFQWAEDSKTLLYLQDRDGDENFHLYAVDLATRAARDLTPYPNVRAGIVDTLPKQPDTVLVQLNLRDRKAFDVHRVSLKTGKVELDTQNPGDVTQWVTDANMLVRAAVAATPEGGQEVRVRETAKLPWKSLVRVGPEESLAVYGFTLDGKGLFLATSIGTDTQRVVEKNLKAGSERLLAKSDTSDPLGVIVHPTRLELHGVAFDVGGHAEWTTLDSTLKADLAAIRQTASGDLDVVSRDLADAQWVVAATVDTGPVRYYRYDRVAKKAELLFSHQPKLEGLPLVEMKPVSFAARDGLVLSGYFTAPPQPKGLVLLVHGGPWGRDGWRYNGEVQLLANRGYAVLQVNFRGSTGYGKRLLNAGNKQWGLAMQTDLLDAVDWAATQGVDPRRVCIMGGSYGGYAALAGAAFTPDAFRCAVDLVGPSNLGTLLRSVPPYWAAMKGQFSRRVGDLDTDAELLRKASPLFAAERIKIPLLIAQGANDPRVRQSESEQVVAALEKAGLPVTYVLYPDEGHGLARPENRTDYYARVEQFLAASLGGRVEPLPPQGRVPGSTGVVKQVKARPAAPAAPKAPAAK